MRGEFFVAALLEIDDRLAEEGPPPTGNRTPRVRGPRRTSSV
ncbi:MAG TPA: hypothetical protein VFV56_03325 [Gaiellaceae bacterium]|nr:hypothetical protein [Gaiellaceae bacterium]